MPEFVQFIQEFYLFACAETKLSRSDSIEVDGYTFYPSKFNRYSHKSGGVGLFVKDNFAKEIDLFVCADHCKWCSEICDLVNVLWFVIGDILLGTIYIPPESYVHANHDIFDQISIAVVESLEDFKGMSIGRF